MYTVQYVSLLGWVDRTRQAEIYKITGKKLHAAYVLYSCVMVHVLEKHEKSNIVLQISTTYVHKLY